MHENPLQPVHPHTGGYQAICNFFCWLRQKLQVGLLAIRNRFTASAADTEQLPKSQRKRQRKAFLRQIQEKEREERR